MKITARLMSGKHCMPSRAFIPAVILGYFVRLLTADTHMRCNSVGVVVLLLYFFRLPYNLYCVGGDVKHCSLTHSLTAIFLIVDRLML